MSVGPHEEEADVAAEAGKIAILMPMFGASRPIGINADVIRLLTISAAGAVDRIDRQRRQENGTGKVRSTRIVQPMEANSPARDDNVSHRPNATAAVRSAPGAPRLDT